MRAEVEWKDAKTSKVEGGVSTVIKEVTVEDGKLQFWTLGGDEMFVRFEVPLDAIQSLKIKDSSKHWAISALQSIVDERVVHGSGEIHPIPKLERANPASLLVHALRHTAIDALESRGLLLKEKNPS